MKSLKIFILGFCLLALPSCKLFGEDSSALNEVSQGLALTAKTFVDFFEDNLDNCEDFTEIYEALGTPLLQGCDNPSGSFSVTQLGLVCESSSPLEAQAQLLLTQNNCEDQETGLLSTGDLLIMLDFSSEGNFAILSSDAFFSEETLFSFENFSVRVDFPTNSLSCSESDDLTVLQDPPLASADITTAEDLNLAAGGLIDAADQTTTCSVRADCEKCTL